MRGYKQFYGITESPFRKDIPVHALLRYAQFDELADYLTYVAEEGSIGLLRFSQPSTTGVTTSATSATRMPPAAC
jgi:hypothetical protein